MALTTNFNTDPYYDDFDENKDFHRILYKPGYAVQSRELTQSQTILQEQIKKFGNHVFTSGSVVTGGQISIQNTVYLNISSTFGSSDIGYINFDKQAIYNTANTKRAYVLRSYDAITANSEPIQFIINQPKPKDLIANRIIGDKIPNSYTAILTSALHSVSIASSVSSDDIISILQKYCIGQLNTLQLQFIMTNMRKSPPSESDIRKVLIYITNPIVLPTYLTSNILMDMLLLSMICKDESLIRLCINLIIESGKTFTLHHVAKHKGLGNIKIDNDLLQFIRKFDDENNKLISKAIKSEDFNELL